MRHLHSISGRLVMAIAGTGAAASLLVGLFSVREQTAFGEHALRQTMALQYESVMAAFEYEGRAVKVAAVAVASLPQIGDLAERKDREALQRLMGPPFEALKREGIPYMNLHEPPAIALFRAQEPKAFGDDISARRKMVLKSNGERTAVAGIEPGRASISVFATVPVVSAARKHIAVADVGLPLGDEFVGRAKTRFGVDLAIHRVEGDETAVLTSTLADKTVAAPAELKRAYAGERVELQREVAGRPVAVLLGPIRNFAGEPAAVLEIVKDNSAFAALAADARQRLILATLGILTAAVLLALLVARGLSRPILALTGSMNRLSGGDTSVAVPGVGRRDELGRMAGAVQVFKDNAIAVQQLRAGQEAAAARAEAEKRAALAQLADGFEASVAGVVATVSAAAGEMQATARSMADAAEQAMRRSGAAESASAETTSNVQTVASATEELSSSIAEIGQQVSQASSITGQAMEQARATTTTVQGLEAAAERIGAVVAMINTIASQTNLLALNATIEAARAGDAGKGFAVVASEVKALATQTARATDEIAAQVQAIQGETRQAVTAIETICGTITGVDGISSSIAAAVEQQGAATHEIARNIQQAATGTAQVSDHVSGLSGAVGDTGAAARLVLDSAGRLASQSDVLRREVDRFLAGVRAA